MRAQASLALFLATLGVAACAAQSSSGPGGQGGGGAGAGGGGSGGDGGGGGGGAGPCVDAASCAHLDGACVVGTCVNGTCETTPANEGDPCDDGKFCSQGEHCEDGVCLAGSVVFCPSPDPCHAGYCDDGTKTCEVMPANDGAQCDDLDECTYDGVCSNGACAPGQPVDCSALDGPCSVGACQQGIGCVPSPVNDGSPCDDLLFCTVNDSCQQGVCTGDPNDCGGNGGGCLVPSCDEPQNKCVIVPGNDGGACDDGSNCTAGEACLAGQCVGGQPANDGAPCDDQDGCTTGTSCAGGACTNATMTNGACGPDDSCCPPGCAADPNCLWWASGVQQNVAASQLVGWTQCYVDDYGNSSTPVSTILQQCDKSKLLMACRMTGSNTLNTLAMGDRVDVLHDCGSNAACTWQANGVGWYFSDSYSWGFAPGGEPVQRNSCDVQNGMSNDRICWHSGGQLINSGYRCGFNISFDASWERVVYEAD